MKYNPTLPKEWSEDLAYLFGLIIGDGSLPAAKSMRRNRKPQTRYLIYFISNSKDFLEQVYVPLFVKLFNIHPQITVVPDKKNPLYNCRIESKELYLFLKNKGMITGRKAKIAKVPSTLPEEYKPYLLAGLLDTDGGKKGSGFGLSTASEYLASFCIEMFKLFNLKHHSCPWHYNDHIYHQIYLPKHEMHKLLKYVPIKNKDKIAFINSASVA